MRKLLLSLIVLIWSLNLIGQNLSEGFEGTTFPPAGWSVINLGDANAWVRTTSYYHTGTACAYIVYGPTAHNDYLITPKLAPTAGNYTLTFWAENYSSSWPEQFNVLLSTTGNAAANFTVTLASGITPPATWTQYSYNLSAYVGQNIYIAIQAISTDQFYLMVDDFAGPPLGGVTDPTSFTATAVSSTQINLGWALNANSNPVMLAYNTTNTFGTPVDGTTYGTSTTLPGGNGTVLYNGSGLFYNQVGLNPNTTYYYKIWSKNGSNAYSSGLATSGTTAASVPFFEGFETGNVDQAAIAKWSQQTVSGSYVWTANSSLTTYNRTPRTGAFDAYLHYSAEEWMFMPIEFVGGTQYDFSMYARQDMSTASYANMVVSYGTAANAASMTNSIVPQTGIINGNYQQLAGSFTPATSGVYYLGIKGYMSGTPWYISIDDISVNFHPLAPAVTTNAATSILSNGAQLNATVSANYASTTVTFEYGTMTGPPFSNTVTVAAPVTTQNAAVNFVISGLAPYTTYYFRAVGQNSLGTIYGTVLSFTTAPVPPSVTTQLATIVGATFATLNGSAIAFNANTTVSFEYGTTTQYLGGPVVAVPPSVTGNASSNFSATITGLTINTTYHYRAKGVSVGGTTYGTDQSFYTTCVVPPVPGAITGPSGVCKTGTGYIYSVSQVPYGFVYNWTFPTGFTITSYPHSNSVTVDVSNTAVSGTVSVIAVSDCGAPSTASTKAVTVNNLPVPTVSGNTPVCQYVNTNYNTEAGQSAYTWSALPDGTVTPTSNPEVVSINWATPGSKTVQVIYTNPATGCTAAAPGGTKGVSVTTAPVPTITGTNTMCMNSGFYDYLTEPGKTGYTWNVSPGGSITAGQGTYDCQVVWNAPGPQWVSVNYNGTGGCAAQTATVFNVSVNGMPGNAGSISGPSTVCFGSTGNVYSVGAISNAAYYVWTLPAGATIVSGIGTNTITVNYSPTAVSGNITVYGNSLCGNGGTSPVFPVTITQLPLAAGTITGQATVCAGATGIAFSVAPVTNATGYQWNLPPHAFIVSGANTTNITVDFAMDATSGNVSVLGTNTCGNGIVSPNFPVTVLPVPSAPVIAAHGDTLFSNVPTGNQWYYEGAPIYTGTGEVLIARYTGLYWDAVTMNGCSSDTSNNIYITITGLNEPAGSSFIVSPVPNDGQFKLMMNTPTTETFDVTISNNIGAKVYEKPNVIVNGPTNLLIDLRPVSAGVYTIIIRNSEHKIVRKIIVNK
ncbi:MAG: choice-of-anchor J domain-containing protein [Bacteroidetes bacterium]|nr:choice-of-anchor J domain-containing protein [Bacteroidota bacterium]